MHTVVELREDEEGICGASLSPQLIKVTSNALTMNIESLAPRVLPLAELCKAGWNMAQKSVLKKKGVQPFVPNFKLAFEHLHPSRGKSGDRRGREGAEFEHLRCRAVGNGIALVWKHILLGGVVHISLHGS
ncbi:hypothetical protein L7F22_036288 [Adiantum nelumboides]|nr:hypothetical protein [Adiantum nelumboides]